MQTEVKDMSELLDLSSRLKSMTNQLDDSVGDLNSTIRQAHNYDGIDISTAANILRNNLKVIASDMKNVSANIDGYTTGISILDQDDFTPEADAFSIGNVIDNVDDFFTTRKSPGATRPIITTTVRTDKAKTENKVDRDNAKKQVSPKEV